MLNLRRNTLCNKIKWSNDTNSKYFAIDGVRCDHLPITYAGSISLTKIWGPSLLEKKLYKSKEK